MTVKNKRPQRRAKARLEARIKHYEGLKDTKGFTKPGSKKCW